VRPIVFAVQVGMQDPDQGPILDDTWPTVSRTEVKQRVLYYLWSVCVVGGWSKQPHLAPVRLIKVRLAG